MNYYRIFPNYYLCFRKNRESEPTEGLFRKHSKKWGSRRKIPLNIRKYWCLVNPFGATMFQIGTSVKSRG